MSGAGIDASILFVDKPNGNYLPAANAPQIDASINTLLDRAAMTNVRDPMGIAVSPILAPERDATGQLRVDDVTVAPPTGIGGIGEQVFKDRGALDRSDVTGPVAILLNPQDNDSEGLDLDPVQTIVHFDGDVIEYFEIQLTDVNGVGPDPNTVLSEALILSEDGHALTEGVA